MPEHGARHRGLWRRLGSRRCIVIDGSMRPTLEPGDRLLVDTHALRRRLPGVGELVVLRDPEGADRDLVKRVTAVDPATGSVTVRGDAPDRSRDSRSFGAVPVRQLVGVVWFRYLPTEKRGPIPSDAASSPPSS